MLLKSNRILVNYRMFKSFFVAVAMLVLTAALSACQIVVPAPVAAEPAPESASAPTEDTVVPIVSTANVHLFPADGENDVAGATSSLERRPDGVTLTIETVDLTPNEAYTVWWVVFNNPAACAQEQCMGPDLSNPETVAMVSYATGEIADENGQATFEASLTVGDATGALDNNSGFPFELVEPAPGLLNPLTAEIHGVIRTHGAALDDPQEQLSSFNGGCNPECVNVQAVLYKAEAMSK
jgi:hypothetical protein